MTQRIGYGVATAMCATLIAAGALTAGTSAQAPPDVPMPGTNLTRTQVAEKLLSSTPGTTVSSERGKKVYEEACAVCHTFDDIGVQVGPDLTTVASRFNRRDLLDAILWPSRAISDQYAVTVFELIDGSIVSGAIVREDARAVYLKNADYLDRPLPVPIGQILERTASTVSLMPENLMASHSLDDIDSLLSFLTRGR